jgi:adenylate cyclase
MLAFHKPNSFPSWSVSTLLDGAIPPKDLKGSIVLIGSRAPSLRDTFQTPFTRFSHQASLETMDGVEVHAQRLAALLDLQAGGRFQMVALPAWLNHGLLLIALALGISLTLLLGVGLMALVFYSARKGFDARAADKDLLK